MEASIMALLNHGGFRKFAQSKQLITSTLKPSFISCAVTFVGLEVLLKTTHASDFHPLSTFVLRENSELTLQLCHLVQGKLQLSK
jgi:hypothetical protein